MSTPPSGPPINPYPKPQPVPALAEEPVFPVDLPQPDDLADKDDE